MNTVTPLRRTLSPGQNNDAALAARLIERYEAARNQRTQWTRLW